MYGEFAIWCWPADPEEEGGGGNSKRCAEHTLEKDELYTISKIINPTKNIKVTHYAPVLWGEMNCSLGKARFKSLRILLDCGASSSIVLGKNTHKLWKKTTKPVRWITQGGDFQTTYKSKVEIVLPELDATNIITWDFHVDDSQGNHKYGMILGRDIFPNYKYIYVSPIILLGEIEARTKDVRPQWKTLWISTPMCHPHGFTTKSFGRKNDGKLSMCWTLRGVHGTY